MNQEIDIYGDEESVGDWMIEAGNDYLKEHGYSSEEEWNKDHPGQDFNEFYAEIA